MSLSDTNGSRESGKPQKWLLAPLLCQETEFRENIFFHRGRIKVQDSYPSDVAACPPPLPGNGVS